MAFLRLAGLDHRGKGRPDLREKAGSRFASSSFVFDFIRSDELALLSATGSWLSCGWLDLTTEERDDLILEKKPVPDLPVAVLSLISSDLMNWRCFLQQVHGFLAAGWT